MVPCVPQTSRPISSRMRATLSPTAGVGRQGEVNDAEGHAQPPGGLLRHQLAHARHLEAVFFTVSATTPKSAPPHGAQRVMHHAGAGDADVYHRVRLAHAVEGPRP